MEPRTTLPSGVTSLVATLAILVAGLGAAHAQDPVFSQYTAAPVYTNPALVGLFEGEVRVVANYREQWSSVLGSEAIRTYAASGELRFNMGGRDYLALAANALQDNGGVARYSITRAGFGVALQKYLSGGRGRDATYLGLGGRVGYGQNRIDADNLWFSHNFDSVTTTITPDGSVGTSGGFIGATRGYLDVSGGINLAVVRHHYSLVVGIAAHHLNQPNASFVFNSEERLAPRYSALLSGEYLIDDHLRLMPSAIYEYQDKAQRLTAGGGVYYRTGHEGDAAVRAGIYGRLTNRLDDGMYLSAIVLNGQLEFKRMTVGLSYDLNTGAVGRATDGRGAYELSFSWTRPGRSRYKVVCPKL